jgi:uncharacterized membrane protein YdjX (TVP38/TMEM64 family)
MKRTTLWQRLPLAGRAALRGLLLIATLVAVGFLLEETRFGTAFDQAWVDSTIRHHGISGELLFVGVAILLTAIGLPRQLVAFLGGYAFGLVQGAALALLGTALSCVAAFYYARLLAHKFVARRMGKRAARMNAFLHTHPFSTTMLIRLLPVGHNLATNLLAGVSSVPPLPFFFGSLIGYLPQTVVFALIGSGVETDPALRLIVGAALFLASAAFGGWLYRRHRRLRAVARELAPELGSASPAGSAR